MNFLKKLLLHRITFVFVSILVQIVVLVWAVFKLDEYFVYFYGISVFISMLSVLAITNSNSNPAYKIAWIIPILSLPVLGGLFYVFFGGSKLNRRTRKKMKYIALKSSEALSSKDDILADIKDKNPIAGIQSTYIKDYAFCPPYDNTYVEYFPLGEDAYKVLIEELKKAKHYIFLEYFIITEGFMWNSILDILIEKAKEGLDVRVMYDDVGCLLTLPEGYDKKLEKLGIKCSVFNPLKPFISFRLNNRNHRKIAVIDGITGFTGGFNLADEYINEYEKYGHWKDTAIMLKGDGVWSLTVMFLTIWDFQKGIDEDFSKFKNPLISELIFNKNEYVQPFTDSPLDEEPVGEIVYLNLINKAKKYVYITTPYLIIGNEMVTALTSAAKGGIDVRIITPHIPDKRTVHEVSRSYYKTLINSGVKIYEYLPGFIHSKSYIVDDEYAVVGTINMDYRSLYLHFECGVWMYNCLSIKDIYSDFMETLERCKQISLEETNNIKWYRTVLRLILRIFSPIM